MDDEKIDHETNKEIGRILLSLFQALEDRVINATEGAELCRAVVVIIAKIRSRLPKLWQRILLDTASNILTETASYLEDLEK